VVGATPQETSFPATARVHELIDLVRAHYRSPVDLDVLLERFCLADFAHREAGKLSGGERRRLAVALAFAGSPRIVFLDEPTANLDVPSRRAVWDAVRAFAEEGRTVVLTTHHLDDAEALASRVVMLANGVAVASGTVPAIKQQAGLKRVRFEVDELPALPGVARATREGRVRTLYVADADSVVQALVRTGVTFTGLEVLPVSLEDAFLATTGAA
jgi:ABC-2 type transport system ATP-binding protein